jgi:hypothetical protein
VTGQSLENLIANQKTGSEKLRKNGMGQPQTNSIEAAAFNIFLEYAESLLGEKMKSYEFEPILDCLYCDYAIRNVNWPSGQYAMLQIKGANVKYGKPISYNVRNYRSDIFVVCIGIRDLVRKEIRENPNDNDSCKLAEVYFIGNAKGITNFSPVLGVKSEAYKGFAHFVCFDKDKTTSKMIQQNRQLILDILNEIEKLPRYTLDQINFDFENINKNWSKEMKVEKKGIQATILVLRDFGIIYKAPFIQNQTIDVILYLLTKNMSWNISFKTASVVGKTGFSFDKKSHPQDHLVDIVIVVYQTEPYSMIFDRLSIIDGRRVYEDSTYNSFCWSTVHKTNSDILRDSTFCLRTEQNKIFERLLNWKKRTSSVF